jgi:hypothetical protein
MEISSGFTILAFRRHDAIQQPSNTNSSWSVSYPDRDFDNVRIVTGYKYALAPFLYFNCIRQFLNPIVEIASLNKLKSSLIGSITLEKD